MWTALVSYFDTYSLLARLQPALLALLPAFVTAAVWVPGLFDRATVVISVAAACGLVAFLAHVSRARGRKVQPCLYVKWGGEPTTRWLSHDDGRLDPLTKARYHLFLERYVDRWKAPTPEDETSDPAAAQMAYESAVRWLREKTRNGPGSRLVFKENVSYGFRRNLYGLKSIGLLLAVCSVTVNALAVWNSGFSDLEQVPPEVTASTVFSLLAVAGWIWIVRVQWVKDAGDGYARALLATCDQPGEHR